MVLQTENRQFVRSECVGCFNEPDEHPESVKKGWRHNTPVRWEKIIGEVAWSFNGTGFMLQISRSSDRALARIQCNVQVVSIPSWFQLYCYSSVRKLISWLSLYVSTSTTMTCQTWLRTQYWWLWWPAACVWTQHTTSQGHEDHSHRISQCSFLLSSVELLCLGFSVVPATIKWLISSKTCTRLSPGKLATTAEYRNRKLWRSNGNQ